MTIDADIVEEARRHLPPAHERPGQRYRVLVRPAHFDFIFSEISPLDVCVTDYFVEFSSERMHLGSGAIFYAWKFEGRLVEWDETDLSFGDLPKIPWPVFTV